MLYLGSILASIVTMAHTLLYSAPSIENYIYKVLFKILWNLHFKTGEWYLLANQQRV